MQNRTLYPDKGYVSLHQETDSLGREVWTFHASDKAPDPRSGWLARTYYLVKGYVVLVHELPFRYQPLDLHQKKQILDCLKTVLGNRIEPWPPFHASAYLTTVMDTPFKPRYGADGNPVRRGYLHAGFRDVMRCDLPAPTGFASKRTAPSGRYKAPQPAQ